jgi:uncharacterized RDD family membrane protein YckC
VSSTAHRRSAPGLAAARAQVVATRVHGEPARRPRVEYQGLVTRGIAFTIDAAVVNIVAVVVAAAAALIVSALSLPDSLDKVLVAGGAWLFLLWSAAYFVTFWSSTGQTPGDRVMKIQVVRAEDGTLLRPRRSLLRLAGVMLAALPLFLGFLPILLSKRRRGLHDMIAGSVVVGAEEPGTESVREHQDPHADSTGLSRRSPSRP